jgi:hypothetical protein
MAQQAWIAITPRERALLLELLATTHDFAPTGSAEIKKLAAKLSRAESHPRITVGVHGGQVEWVAGNPFPIRVLDYDGPEGMTEFDEDGNRCRMWFEPADRSAQTTGAWQIRRRANHARQ